MSEKRFTRGLNYSCFDNETRKSYWYACNLCGLLNYLLEENRELRQKLDFYLLDEFEWKEKYGD